jgi:hypothetical protein
MKRLLKSPSLHPEAASGPAVEALVRAIAKAQEFSTQTKSGISNLPPETGAEGAAHTTEAPTRSEDRK